MGESITAATTKVFETLHPLPSEERLRVVDAVLTLLGESAATFGGRAANGSGAGGSQPGAESNGDGELKLSGASRAWARKHRITPEKLQRYFDIAAGKAAVIGLPGSAKEKKAQVLTTYLMAGLANFLATGDASFSDDVARELCVHFGCYDGSNHSKYLPDLKNRVTGSKTSGWRLTAPGLEAAGELLKGQ